MFNAYRYQLSFKQPFVTGAGTFKHREGIILRYHDSETDSISEAAPLPGFSNETLSDTIKVLTAKRQSIFSFFSDPFDLQTLAQFTDSFSDFPALQCAISMLGLQILADRNEKTVSDLLDRPAEKSLMVNAVAGYSDPQDLKSRVTTLYEEGFRVFKCKAPSDPGYLPDALSGLTATFSDISFRLDANRSWPGEDVARYTKQFSHLPIEYLEEPTMLHNAEEFSSVAVNSVLPLAADESISQFGFDSLADLSSPPDYYILKPMFLGNLINLFATMDRRDHLVNSVIFTTALESVVGRRIVARIAAMYGSPKAAHGLNTGTLFKDDLTADNPITGGHYNLDGIPEEFITFGSLNTEQLEPLF